MKNILFPTDFSEAANQAFIYALHLADKWKARITTLHAYQKPDVSGVHLPITLKEFYDSLDLFEFESYRDAIPDLVHMAEKNGFGHIGMQHVLEEGPTVKTICEVAKRDQVDLIVMGTTGARGLKEIFMGSVAGEVLENACCPVLAVPEKASFDGMIDNVAFTTSFAEEEKKALERLQTLLIPFQPQIHCINVDLAHTEELTHRMDRFRSSLENVDRLSFAVLDATDIQQAITNYLGEHRIDILAMLTHKRSFLQELFHYSKTKMMSYHAEVPVLALHGNNRKAIE